MNWPNDGPPVTIGNLQARMKALREPAIDVPWWARIWRRVLLIRSETGTPRRMRGHEDMAKGR